MRSQRADGRVGDTLYSRRSALLDEPWEAHGFWDVMKVDRTLCTLFLISLSASAQAETVRVESYACDLTDAAVLKVAADHMKLKWSWREGAFEVHVSKKYEYFRTVVAAPLPRTPSTAVILHIACQPGVVREITSATEASGFSDQ